MHGDIITIQLHAILELFVKPFPSRLDYAFHRRRKRAKKKDEEFGQELKHRHGGHKNS